MHDISKASHGQNSLVERFDKRWIGVSLAAAAGTVAVSETADAALVTFNSAINVPATTAGVYINLETGANGTSQTAANGGNAAAAPVINLWGTSAFRAYFYPTTATVNRYVSNTGTDLASIAVGATVGPASTYATARNLFTTSAANTTFNQTAGFDGYFGFRFLNTAGTNTYYGYAHVRTNPWTGGTTYAGGQVLEITYDDSGAPVQVGAVPEPTSIAALALGAAGLVMRRRSA